MPARITRHETLALIARASEQGTARLTAHQVQAFVSRGGERGTARLTQHHVQAIIKRSTERGTARITRHQVQALTNNPAQVTAVGDVSIGLTIDLGTATTAVFDRFADRSLLAGDFRIDWRVEVQDIAGTWIDLTAYAVTADWGDSIDATLATGQIALVREVDGVTLSPTVGASTLNALGPLLDVGRGIRIWTATVPISSVPSFPSDYWVAMDGVINDLDWTQQILPVNFSDARQRLVRKAIRVLRTYGGTTPVPMETVMAQILADNGAAYALDCPASPLFNLYTFTQQIGPVLEALQKLAANIGWVVRPCRISKTDFVLRLFAPPRAKTTPDFTLPPSEYLDVQQMGLLPDNIRNIVRVEYGGTGAYEEVGDPDSIERYGECFIVIGRDQTARISSPAQAIALANNVLNDLKLPYATHSIRSLYLPFVYLYDLLALPANSRHYDADQAYGVTGYRHSATGPGMITTTIATRGKVAGSYSAWFTSSNAITDPPTDTPTPPTPTPSPTPTPRFLACSVSVNATSHTPGPVTVNFTGADLPAGGSYNIVLETSALGSITAATLTGCISPTPVLAGAYTDRIAPPGGKFVDRVEGRVDMLDGSNVVVATIPIPYNQFYYPI